MLDRLPHSPTRTVLILQQVGQRAVQDARPASSQCGRVLAADALLAASLHAHQAHLLVTYKGVEHADGVGPAANTGQHGVRQPTHFGLELGVGVG